MNMTKNINDEIRPPSLDGLRSSVIEMMDMKTGKRKKTYVKRKRKS